MWGFRFSKWANISEYSFNAQFGRLSGPLLLTHWFCLGVLQQSQPSLKLARHPRIRPVLTEKFLFTVNTDLKSTTVRTATVYFLLPCSQWYILLVDFLESSLRFSLIFFSTSIFTKINVSLKYKYNLFQKQKLNNVFSGFWIFWNFVNF